MYASQKYTLCKYIPNIPDKAFTLCIYQIRIIIIYSIPEIIIMYWFVCFRYIVLVYSTPAAHQVYMNNISAYCIVYSVYCILHSVGVW